MKLRKKIGIGIAVVLVITAFTFQDIMATVPANHVNFSTSVTRLESQLQNAVSQLHNAQNIIVAVDGIMGQCVYADNSVSGNVNYSTLETVFGITGNGSAGDTSVGYNVKYQFDNVTGILTNTSAGGTVNANAAASAIQQFLNQLG